MKKHNFSAGPCILPQEVLLQASESIMDFNQSGLSLIEISHRSKPFVDVIDEAKDIALDLLNLKNKGYQVLEDRQLPMAFQTASFTDDICVINKD